MRFEFKSWGIRGRIKTIVRVILSFKRRYNEVRLYQEGTVVLWGVPEYGNLGDQAIAYAERMFVQNYLPERALTAITERKCEEYIYPLKLLARKKKIIFAAQGGGNIGTLYPYQERRRQMLIKNIKNCKIIVFPQSADFNYGSKAHNGARRVYAGNHNLHLFARDRVNYEKLKKLFPECKIHLSPDIVTSIDRHQEEDRSVRKGVLCCLRSDKEINIKSKAAVKEIINYIGDDNCEYIDTYDPKFAKGLDGQAEQLESFWKHIREAKLIITDRLHGMIFAMINNTPCIAFDNSTGKVEAFYNSWLSGAKGIMLGGRMEEAKKFIDLCLGSQFQGDAYVDLSGQFEDLIKELITD